MQEIKDLLYISLNAQYNYILDRYNSKKELNNFENASQFILSCIDSYSDYDINIVNSFTLNFSELGFNNKVAQDCYHLYEETKELMMTRFVYGWTSETMLEKL